MFVWNNGILNLVWNNVILKISFPFLPLESSGVSKYRLCSLAQYINLVGVTIGYTITTAISMGYFFFFPDDFGFASVSGTTTAHCSHVSRWYANTIK